MAISLLTPDDLVSLEERVKALEEAPPPPPPPPPPLISQAVVLLSDFNAPNDGSADAVPAWNAMLAASKAKGLPILVPRGKYRLDSRPNVIDFCARIEGIGESETGSMLIKNYAESVAAQGMLEFTPPSDGSRLDGFYIKNVASGGALIAAKATPTATMTNLTLCNLNLSLDDPTPPDHYILFDGSAKSSGAKGNRINHLSNVKMFGARWASAVFKSCNGLWWNGGGIYMAGGPDPAYAGAIVISGTTDVPSTGIKINIQTCGGLILTQTVGARLEFEGLGALNGVSIQNDATVQLVRVFARASGSVQTNWVNSALYS